VAKANKNRTRREMVAQMRLEAQRAERRRTLLVVAVCAGVALLIVGLAGWTLYQDNQEKERVAGQGLAALGVPATQAGCSPVAEKTATGASQHEPEGTAIGYDQAPPAYGPHYAATAPFGRTFYTSRDRPALGNLVHNLEHGYTILWYDDTLAEDSKLKITLEAIADKAAADEKSTAGKFIVAPYTGDDPGTFPAGKHVALTHWSATFENGQLVDQQGVTQYCAQPSGEVVADFIAANPYTSSPEPNAL
jgi:hypothetical protein